MQSLPPGNQIQSVGDLTAGIKLLLEDTFPAIWVKGEVSNLKYQSSGHIYFSLKDNRAQIGAVMFRGDAQRLPFQLKDGMEVIVFGNISVYEPRGNYQLIVRQCVEEGVGKLQAEFERLKRKLSEEGLFAPERKKPLPELPRRIGIITSPTGAALKDFVSILRRREWNGEVVLFPAIVQGKEGAPDILEKLEWAERYGELDLLVLARGGGSIEDLWNFNEETVVRALCRCSIPTISAVGHEIDFVLTDFAADKRAETPSAAAELISSGYLEIRNRLKLSAQNLQRATTNRLQQVSQLLLHTGHLFRAHSPKRRIENHYLRLDELQERFSSRAGDITRKRNNAFSLVQQRFTALHPEQAIRTQHEHLSKLESLLKKDAIHCLRLSHNTVDAMDKRISSLGVDQVLKRGYAIVRDAKDRIVTSSQDLKPGQTIQTQFHDGKREAIVKGDNQLDLFGDV